MSVAHKIGEKPRTDDIVISEPVDFCGLLLSKNVLCGLQNAGFERPSPIQLKAIPLGRCGLDLIVQAKSGTGKTCVFAVIALESLQVKAPSTQVLVLAPTREVAIQIWEVIGSLGSAMPGLRCHTFIGGMPVHEDRKKLQLCHIAVGTPGRIQSLIEAGWLKTESIRLYVLDEADKLLEDSFQETINWIYSALPENKQMLALSATYPESMAQHLTLYMRNPTFIRLNVSDPTLLGIKQYVVCVPNHPLPNKVFDAKTAIVVNLLSSVTFHQCLIFSNVQTRAQNLENDLTSQGWPTACIAGSLDQKDRITAMAKLKSYQCRVLISTDLTSRGIDADKVNLVINLDVPRDHETYLHRIGRAGRFGSYGVAVTIVSEGQELLFLQALEQRISTFIQPLPDPVPSDLVQHQLNVKLEDIVSTEQLFTLPKVTHLAMAKSGLGTEVLTPLQNQQQKQAETGNLSQLDSQDSEGTEETGQDDFSVLRVKNDVKDHHSCLKESGGTNFSHTQNDVPENDVLNSSVLPSEQEWRHSCTNGQIVAPGLYDLKNHSSAKGWMNADGQIASKKSETENLQRDLALEKKHEVAVGISQPVSAEIVRAENKEQVIVQEEIKVVLHETFGKCVAASSKKQSGSMSDSVDSEIVSDNNQTLSEGSVNQIRTSSCREQAYLDEAEKEYRLGEACICEIRSKHASGETCLGVAGIQQTSGEICLSRTKLEEKEKTHPGEGSMHSLEQRHFDKEVLERLEIGEKLVSSDQSHVCSFGSEATDQTLQRNMAIKGKEKMDASCDDKSTDQSRLDGSGIHADGGEVKCNKTLPSTGAEDETHHDKLVISSLPEVTGDAQNHEEFNGDTSKSFVSYSETPPLQVASKVANKKSSKVSAAAKMWEETLGTDLSDQEKVKGNPSTLRVVKEQIIKGTSLGKGHAQENSRGLSENRFKQNSKISSGASAVAKLWGEMLSTDAGNDTDNNSKDAAASKCSERLGGKKSCVNSDDDEQCASLRDSENTQSNQVDNEKMTLRNQKEQRGRGKDVGEQRKSRKELSWESELALYVAARAKLNAADPDKGEIKETVENYARPQKQARRRLAGGKTKTSAQENCEKEMPESSTDNTAVLLETAQSADNLEEKCEMDKTSVQDAENRTSQNCPSKLSVKVSCVPNKAVVVDCTAGAVSEIIREGRKEADKTHTTLEEGHQSRDKSDMKFDSAVAFKESEAAEMSGSLASGAEEGTSSLDHAVDIQGHADISVGSILQKSSSQTRSDKGSWGPFYPSVAVELSHILSRLSTPQTTRLIRDPHTYSSALQDYSRFLEQDPIAEPPSMLDLVNRTFRCSDGAVPAEDLSKISKFLDNFHRDIQCRVLLEKPVLEESDCEISSYKEDLVDKAVQTEHSFLYLNDFEQEKDSEVLTFRSESHATIANSGKDSRVGINSSGHGAEIDLECRGTLVAGPDKAQAAVLQRERQMMGLPVSSTSCIYGESPLASSGDGEQNFDLPPERPNLEQHGDRKHSTAKTAVESMVQNEKAPPTDVAIEKSSSAQRQGSNLLPVRGRANRNETLKDRHKCSAEETSSDAVRKRKNLSPKVSSSDKPCVKQEDFQKSEVEESSFSSSNTSSFSSDNEETAAAEKSDDRSTVFYKNHYTHEPALPRGRTVPPKLREAERGDPNKRHERQNVTGACSSKAEKRHRPFDFFEQHASPDQKALNSWRAWYSQMQSGYPYAPLQTGYQRSTGRPFSHMPASFNPPQVNFPHYDSTMHQSYYGSTPWPVSGYYLENNNCRCSQRPCNASSAAAQKLGALSVQSVWSTATSQQEYIKWMTGFYRELARLELSSPRS